MKRLDRFSVILALVAVGCSKDAPADAPVVEKKNGLPIEAELLLGNAPDMELFALDPKPRTPESTLPAEGQMHGYGFTGRAIVKDKVQRKALAEMVLRGIRESDGKQAKCFEPRHGMRVAQGGKTLELLICYECLSIEAHGSVFGEGAEKRIVLTSASVEPAMTKAFTEAGLTIAAK